MMFARLVEQIRTEAEVHTGGKEKKFFTGTTEKHYSATPEIFKWASRRKNVSDELKVHAPHKRKTDDDNDENGDS